MEQTATASDVTVAIKLLVAAVAGAVGLVTLAATPLDGGSISLFGAAVGFGGSVVLGSTSGIPVLSRLVEKYHWPIISLIVVGSWTVIVLERVAVFLGLSVGFAGGLLASLLADVR